MNQQNKDVLPDGMVEWIESATSSRVVNIEAAVGAGVSREGAYISLVKEGESLEAYLAYDVRRADDPARSVWCRREASALRLAEKHGLRAPRVLASWPEQRAILTRRFTRSSTSWRLIFAGTTTRSLRTSRESSHRMPPCSWTCRMR